MIGERTNANGSKAFREAMIAEDWQKCLDIAKDQTRDGAHMLDLCVDYVGRDGVADMNALASRLATASTLPIMLDSTETPVLRAGLEHLGGRCAVNSVNYEDGDGPESRFHKTMELVAEHGAAVVALTIDEEGQARTAEKKVEIAERLIDDITGNWGVDESDIIIDTPDLHRSPPARRSPARTASRPSRRSGELKQRHPDVQTTLGLSNISFGLNPAARQVLNSVFLHECQEAGLDSAIVHASKILPMNRIPDEQREVALDLVYDRRREGYDPLQELMELFEGVSAASSKESRAEELATLPLFERLERRIVDGERNGLEADLDEAMTEKPPLEIINENLLAGMKTVGELFGSGQMQLPFVLQSAEVMKAAVAYLEPHMEKADDDAGKGRIVLATVKGDVHDIGKNLVDIILTNNGYEVVNIGIKQPIATILEAAEDKSADVIGMSGLLVKSTVVMKENLAGDEHPRGGREVPGAARRRRADPLLRGERPRRGLRGRRPLRARRVRGPAPDGHHHEPPSAARRRTPTARRRSRRGRRRPSARPATSGPSASRRSARPTEDPVEVPERSDVAADVAGADAAVLGHPGRQGRRAGRLRRAARRARAVPGPVGAARRSAAATGPSYEELVETEGRPRLRYWLDRLSTEGILAHAAVVYGYFPAVSEGDDVVVLDRARRPMRRSASGSRSRASSATGSCASPTSSGRGSWPRETGQVDVLPFQLVTMGQPIADFANELFAADSYRDYLEVHGIGVQLTEALAEYWHRRVREELRFPATTRWPPRTPTTSRSTSSSATAAPATRSATAPAPNLEDRAKMVDLLEPERIGVTLSEELQLHPEQSTDAFVLHHPEAKYFNV